MNVPLHKINADATCKDNLQKYCIRISLTLHALYMCNEEH